MVFAFFRLFVIAIASVLTIFIIVISLRMVGEKQVYTVPPHRLLKIKPFDVAWGGDSTQAPAFSLKAYQRAAKEHFVLGALVHAAKDGVWFVASTDKLAQLHKGTGWISHATSKQLKGILRFSTLIKALPKANYYVQIEDPATPLLKSFFNDIERAHLADHFVLTSPFEDTVHMIRNANPNWLVGAYTADIAKAWLMSSMYLEPIMSLNCDEFTLPVSPLPSHTKSLFDSLAVEMTRQTQTRLLKELKKRKILVLVRSNDPKLAEQLVEDHLATGAIFPSNALP